LNGVLFDKNQTTLLEYPGGLKGSYAIPASVANIGMEAFQLCYGLTSVTIPRSVTNIGDDPFLDCINLTNIYFGGNPPLSTGNEPFNGDNATIYYLPGTTGWTSPFFGLPVVLWNPLIKANGTSFGVLSNQFGFNITDTNNLSVVVEACTNLAKPVWTPLTNVTLTNGSYYFSDPQWTNYPGRYYRITSP
jgi:hypothetical protein